ncbi:MAG TPA: 30S ribosomal protein S20 [Nitrospiria bacterium]|nr:30S ribosomal protein S20 [Nitrospiria bacterium]
MNRPSTAKRIRQNAARTLRNRAIRSELKTRLKAVKAALDAKDVKSAAALLPPIASSLGKAASKRIITRARASRTTARLAKRLHQLSATAS